MGMWPPQPGFVAVTWKKHDASAGAAAASMLPFFESRGLERIFSARGFALYARLIPERGTRYFVLGHDTIALGSMFAANGDIIDSGDFNSLANESGKRPASASTRAKEITLAAWGRYVAFIANGEEWSVLRDPSGGVPCWLASVGNVHIVFSCADDVRGVLRSVEPDWSAVSGFLVNARIDPRLSGLKSVRAVPAAMLASLDGSNNEEVIWSPEEAASRSRLGSIGEALALCVRAWASLHRRVGHQLSGGIDSSCVLACLVRSKQIEEIDCWTFYPSDASEEDERAFARATAAACGVRLHEFEMSAKGVHYSDLESGPLHPKPVLSDLSFADRRLVEWQASRNFTALMSGEGGDHLMLRSHAALFPIDWTRAKGIRPDVLRVIADASQITGLSFWSLAARTWREGWLRCSSPRTIAKRRGDRLFSGLQQEFAERDQLGLSPGKARQASAVAEAREYFNPSVLNVGFAGCPAMLSQPFIEACLATPVYEYGVGGFDRAPLRRAFADTLPKGVLRRRSKAGMTRYYCDGLLANIDYVRGLLLDGVCVREGLIAREELEHELRRQTIISRPALDPILALVATEHWLARWR